MVRKPGLYLASNSFEDGAIIPNKYTVSSTATPVSPELHWTNVPDGTVSFALILDDQDDSRDKTTNMSLHWLIFNIPGTTRELPEAVPNLPQLPDGSVQGKLNPKTTGYLGMGMFASGPYHHYVYWLFALDTTLPLTSDATRAEVYKAVDGHILGKAVLVSRFHQ